MRRFCAIVLAALLAAACVRGGPPAPVTYKSGGEGGATGTAAASEPREAATQGAATSGSSSSRATDSRSVHEGARGRHENGVHVVARGDTVYGIARRYQVPIRDVIEANDLSPPYHLHVDQRVRIPELDYHVVERGDTLYSISRSYTVDVHELARLNELTEPHTIRPGEILRLPGSGAQPGWIASGPEAERDPVEQPREDLPATVAEVAEDPPPAPAEPPEARDDEGGGIEAPATVAEPEAPRTAAVPDEIPQPPARESGRFFWPVRGEILVPFGPQDGGLHNDGINVAAPAGTPVRAAENGVVVYVGNELRGFGNLLLIKHEDDWITAYAHLDEIAVARGQQIRRGETVARVGNTGSVSRPQLHFEVRRGSRVMNPLEVMEEMEASARPTSETQRG